MIKIEIFSKKLFFLLFLINTGCNSSLVNIEQIESSMNASIGKPFLKLSIDKLINESDDYQEYETGLGNDCRWAVKVIKKTNIIESWRITSDRKPCEEGVIRYSGH